jgi:hypothetical protein
MSEPDVTFRYKIDPGKTNGRPQRDRCTRMIGDQLRHLLNVVIPCRGEDEVTVDGFKPINQPNQIYPLFEKNREESSGNEAGKAGRNIASNGNKRRSPAISYQSIQNASLYEPRIELIKKQLESLLSLVELESDGEVARIDGFRLKDLKDWIVPVSSDPSEVFEHAGTRCSCDCVFCYNKGTPPSLALQSPARSPSEEFEELRTRIKYYNPVADRGLFPTIGSPHEVLVHPHIIDVLGMLRKKTDKLFRIVTNGAALNPEVIDALAGLAPVYLDVDLNSSNPDRRRSLMRDKNPRVAIGALSFLKEKNIPYSVIIVPWPQPTPADMLDDLEKTIDFARGRDAHLVQVSMPGYSGYLSSEPLFDHKAVWRMIADKVVDIREKFEFPVVIMPGMYEENVFREKKNVAEIIGLVKNSPAAAAGLKRGDVIRRIGGIRITSRPQARDILSIIQKSPSGTHVIEVERNGLDIECLIDLGCFDYPYSPHSDTHAGVIFMGTGIRLRYIDELRQMIRLHRAKRVLFLSSALMKPGFQQQLVGQHGFGDVELRVEVPENRFFGGNIFMGDLLVVEDFIRCIENYTGTGDFKPDLVIIPSSPFHLSQWGRDLTGRCYLDIERKTGIPVALLPCDTIFD